MTLVLDSSVTMTWLLGDAKPSDHAYCSAVLAEMAHPPDPATFDSALASTLQLARRYELSAHDASYLELALRGGLPLATLDRDFVHAARKAGVKIFQRPQPVNSGRGLGPPSTKPTRPELPCPPAP